MEIHQGDIYWVALPGPPDGGPPAGTSSAGRPSAIPHPYVVVQEDVFNRSRIHTVIVCALTTNQKRASLPGNVLLEPGEANLPRPSVVEVSKLTSVDKTQLGEYIGSLTRPRIDQILAGIQFLQRLSG
jgi:mRNA interferase MazF